MGKPALHVQNVYDVLNPLGAGVNGYLKLKCVQVQNRVVCLANSGDVVAISDDCPRSFVPYMLGILGAQDVTVVRYRVSRNLRRYLNAYAVFESLVKDPRWETVRRIKPHLEPYMQSPAVYKAARESGIPVPQQIWKTVATDRLAEKMNDKALFHRECEALGIPVPTHWIVDDKELISKVTNLLKSGMDSLYIRQTRSAGAFGNITVKRKNGRYYVSELGANRLNQDAFTQVLKAYMRDNFWDQFVIAQMLDLYASPGTLFYAGEEEVSVICHSYQVLTQDRRFLGFVYPIRDKKIRVHFTAIEAAIRQLVEPWRQRGYRGYGNIDWMVTKTGQLFIAERNARQTAIIPALHIAGMVSQTEQVKHHVVCPKFSIFTQDRVYFKTPVAFEDVHARLKEKNLLLGQSAKNSGVIISSPPSPSFGINSAGIIVLGTTLDDAFTTYRNALQTLGTGESRLLFKLEF